jgi:trans-aconitate 2-methyltransferase
MWNPAQYGKFGSERDRPFFDLLAHVDHPAPREIADLGCGTAHQTAILSDRWPEAHVVGVDDSPEMLAKAAREIRAGRLELHLGDLATFQPRAPLDLIVSNAALHRVPDHPSLVPRLVHLLAPGGVLAVQVPSQHAEPSHRLATELAAEPGFADALAGVRWRTGVLEPRDYLELLAGLGLAVDVWQTTYLHVLAGDDAVLEWLDGTTLRPVYAALTEPLRAEYRAALRARLAAAYPRGPAGTVFPFRRTFFVAKRRSE